MNLNDDVVYRRRRLGPLHQRHPGRSRGLVRHHNRLHPGPPGVEFSPLGRLGMAGPFMRPSGGRSRSPSAPRHRDWRFPHRRIVPDSLIRQRYSATSTSTAAGPRAAEAIIAWNSRGRRRLLLSRRRLTLRPAQMSSVAWEGLIVMLREFDARLQKG